MEGIKEITPRNVLLECLEYERGIWKRIGKKYGLLPTEGLDAEWEAQRRKCEILQDLIQALESEPVRRSIANWQKELMQEPEKARAEAMRFAEETST